MSGSSSSSRDGIGSNGAIRPPSSAAGRAVSPFPKPRPPAAPRPDGEPADQWQGGAVAPLRGRRRVAGGDAAPPTRPEARLDPAAALLVGSPVVREGHDGLDEPPDSPRGPLEEPWHACLMREPLLLFTLVGVAAGVALGAALRPAKLSAEAIDLIGFPGELMLRLLKMMVLPLVSVSMVSGVCSLRRGNDGGGTPGAAADGAVSVRRLAWLTAAFYIGSTALAIVVGILLVVAVRPGRGAPFDAIAGAAGGCRAAQAKGVAQHAAVTQGRGTSTTEALMNVARQVVPDNVVGAAVDMNVLGLITFSLMFGLALSSLGSAADGLVKAFGVLNAAVQRMVMAALWASPLGIGALIAASMLRACDLAGTLAALGLWVGTVVAGLALFAGLVLPLILWLATGRSPLEVARPFAQALVMAFGTSTSAAALPLAMQAAKGMGCDEATVDFFLPLGTTVNMNGTALYEATTAIFIAQAHGVQLGVAQLLVVAFTASLAAVGAPAIPSAGLVTMLIVLQAVSLERYAADLAVILAIDWLLDRVRTCVNLLGDAMGVVLVDHLMQRRPRGNGEGGGAKQQQIPYIQLGRQPPEAAQV